MMTRGLYIGKIVDDISSLKYQIESRNAVGLFDLTKFSEDFIREVLNMVYGYNLVNLNGSRSNAPGLDLGDDKASIAFQVTSQRGSTKVNKTLEAISDGQIKAYKSINVFVVGTKQSSYSLDSSLCTKCSFSIDSNIWDLNDLLREIVVLGIDQLESIYSFFKSSFRQFSIEFEIVKDDGDFESSYYRRLEEKPAQKPINARKFLPDDRHYKQEFEKLLDAYDRLANVPRVTREILSIIVDRGKLGNSHMSRDKYRILPGALERWMKFSQEDLKIEIDILESEDLVQIYEDSIGGRDVYYIMISDPAINNLFWWMVDQKMSVRTMLNKMDFTVLDLP